MATIITKNSSTAGAAPLAADLVQGELAVNVTSKALYTKNASAAIVKLNTPSIVDNGDATAITIDSSENVGIGTSSPGAKLDVVSAASATATSAAGILVGPNSGAMSAGDLTGLGFKMRNSAGGGVDGGLNLGAAIYGIQTLNNSNTGGLAFYTRLDATTFSERARIDSSGNLLVAKTATSSTTFGAEIRAADATFYSTCTASTNTTSTYNVYSTGASAYRFYVGLAGTIYATSTSITGISDQRLKENIRDLDDGLDKVMALKPRKFDWKKGKGADIKDARGFIAQEFETVFPDLIDEWKDPAPEGEEPYKSVRADLIPTLVKAIQELKAIVDAQAVEIAALKGTA